MNHLGMTGSIGELLLLMFGGGCSQTTTAVLCWSTANHVYAINMQSTLGMLNAFLDRFPLKSPALRFQLYGSALFRDPPKNTKTCGLLFWLFFKAVVPAQAKRDAHFAGLSSDAPRMALPLVAMQHNQLDRPDVEGLLMDSYVLDQAAHWIKFAAAAYGNSEFP